MLAKRVFIGFCFIAIFGGGVGFGIARSIYMDKDISSDIISSTDLEKRLGGYTYINPLLECNIDQSIGGREFRDLETSLEKYIQVQKNDGIITDAAIYYRSLNNGPWFGVNERADFSPASLLKLPVMIAYFKKAESEPDILKKKILYLSPVQSLSQTLSRKEVLKIGEEYTIERLIEHMVEDSDNTSLVLLEQNIEPVLIDNVTRDLGIATANENTPEDYMSVKDYSALFRVLYNASYLTADYSERALAILSASTYMEGLDAGIPDDVKIAHKMGERELPGGIKQLHDCGIVYYPDKPYLLCIMTRGNDFAKLAGVISKISSDVYEEMKSDMSNLSLKK